MTELERIMSDTGMGAIQARRHVESRNRARAAYYSRTRPATARGDA